LKIPIDAVFIDRDGTIGGDGHFIHPEKFVLYPFSTDAIQLLIDNGLKIFAFTNQHRISRGEVLEEDFLAQFKEYGFDDAYICPHPPDSGCDCHKK
jgi:histidinol phosphatase-like enzyme